MVDVRKRFFNEPFDARMIVILNDYLSEMVNAISLSAFGSRTHDVEILDSGVANSDIIVPHNLGKDPGGYVVTYQNVAGTLYKSSWNTTSATFKFSGTNANIKLRLFS